MTKKAFQAKAEKQLLDETRAYFDKHFSHLSDEDREKLVKDWVANKKKNEDFKDSLHSQKKKRDAKIEKLEKNPKEGKEPTNGGSDKSLISDEDKMYFFGKLKGSRTELRQLNKIMGVTGKSFDEAQSDNMYKSWKRENENKIKSKKASMGPAGNRSAGADKGPKPSNDKESDFVEAIDREIKNI